MTRKRAAYFELRADYFGRPFDDGILWALDEAGFDVDVFSPGGELPQTLYPHVTRRDVEYRRRWLQSQILRSEWRKYALFLGTADIPMAFAGLLAFMAMRPSATACDEVYLGGYEGHATGYWNAIARGAMKRSKFTIITDLVREPLQREYAGIKGKHEFLPFPSCYPRPYDGPSHADARTRLGIAEDEFIVSFAGTFAPTNGADWVVRLLGASDPTTRFLIQTGGRPDPVVDALLTRLDAEGRVIYRPERLGWRESTELTAAADASLVFYLSQKPQFQKMGVSSQKLGTSLWLSVPVVATRQPSFEFIADFRCGELVEFESEVTAALARIRADKHEYAVNCAAAVRDYIRPAEKMRALAERFRRV